jgi:DNA-binding CsgD family transcriptional regulator
MAVPDWRTLALSLVELAAAARSRDELIRDLFATIDRELGVDCGSVGSLDGREFLVWNKPDACVRLWHERKTLYIREALPLVVAAEKHSDVAYDHDVLSIHARARSALYGEFMPLCGADDLAAVVVRASGSPSHLATFSRCGGFRRSELDLLRRIGSAVSVAVRICPAPKGGARRRDARDALTPREAQIAEYVSRGFRNAEVAALCGSSPFTVRNQLQTIFRKLDVSTRAELAGLFLGEPTNGS